MEHDNCGRGSPIQYSIRGPNVGGEGDGRIFHGAEEEGGTVSYRLVVAVLEALVGV